MLVLWFDGATSVRGLRTSEPGALRSARFLRSAVHETGFELTSVRVDREQPPLALPIARPGAPTSNLGGAITRADHPPVGRLAACLLVGVNRRLRPRREVRSPLGGPEQDSGSRDQGVTPHSRTRISYRRFFAFFAGVLSGLTRGSSDPFPTATISF